MRKSVVTRIQKSINSCLLQLGLSEEGCDNQLLQLDVLQGQVVRKVVSALQWVNLYPVDNAIGFPNTLCWIVIYLVNGIMIYPTFEQPGPVYL